MLLLPNFVQRVSEDGCPQFIWPFVLRVRPYRQCSETELHSIRCSGRKHGWVRHFRHRPQRGGCDGRLLHQFELQLRRFIRSSDGRFETFRYRKACTTGDPDGCEGTGLEAINASGLIAGGYVDKNFVQHALLMKPAGTVMPYDAPGRRYSWKSCQYKPARR